MVSRRILLARWSIADLESAVEREDAEWLAMYIKLRDPVQGRNPTTEPAESRPPPGSPDFCQIVRRRKQDFIQQEIPSAWKANILGEAGMHGPCTGGEP